MSGVFNIISHHGTALAHKEGSVYASKVAVDAPPLAVSFVPVDEPTGMTRFVPKNQGGEKRTSEAGAEAAAKRSKVSPDAGGAASSPPVSPILPPSLPNVSPHTVWKELTEMGHADVADAWFQKHSNERAAAHQAQP